MPKDYKKSPPDAVPERRISVIGLAIFVALSALVVRLWDLQVVHWGEYRTKSDSNRLRIQRLESPRGMILGRNGNEEVALADNRAARDLMFVPAECDRDPAEVVELMERIAGIDGEKLNAEIARALKGRQPYRQITVKKDVPRSVLAQVEEYAYALPGVFTVVRPQRRYLYGETAGQVMGYLNEISRDELEQQDAAYNMGDLMGRSGLEETYESLLHGQDGRMLVTKYATGLPQIRTDAYGRPFVEVDEFGHSIRMEEEIQEPVPGKNLHVTLDIGLQATCESLLQGEEGAIVVLNAVNGEMLAMASAPNYDPNIFVMHGAAEKRQEALHGEAKRMLHRAFREGYAPGSVFKVLLAAAALDEGVIDEHTTFYCPGKFRLTPGGRPWHCWRHSGHGNVSVVDALAFSCDVFFYNVGLALGVDGIHKWATQAGMGGKTGIDLPGEVTGLVPSQQWKEALLKPKYPNEPWEYKWYPGDTVNLSIGQGSMVATPLQNAVLMASIVNGGHRVRPHLLVRPEEAPPARIWSDATIEIIRRGLLKCVEKGPPAPTGTGKEARVEGMTVIGKTGSAQMVGLAHHDEYKTEEDIPKHLRDHAWFVAGVMDRDPPIAMCILVEHGHHGSSVAAPLAKKIIEYFYDPARRAPSPIQPEGGALAARNDGEAAR